jgi:hypothetical protein
MTPTTSANIVLIHGTFAPNAEWIRPDSFLCTALRVRFPSAEFFPFTWNGRNSHSARIASGKRLAEFLQALKAEGSGHPCYVIAHSHGGNVVLYALSQPSAEACVDGCVFLGTPFINTRRRDLALYLDTIAFELTWLIAYVPLTVLLVLRLGLVKGLLASMGVLFFAIPYAAAPAAQKAVTKRIRDALSETLSALQSRFFRYVTPAALKRPSLVCYVQGDEAKAWLGVVNSASRSPFIVNDYLLQFLQTWPILLAVAAVARIADWMVGERTAFAMRALLPSMVILLSGLFLIVVLSFVLPLGSVATRAHRAGFGWEGLFGYSLVDLFTTVYPACATDAVATAIAFKPQRGRVKGFRHSGFYLDANVVKSIGDWLERPPCASTLPGPEWHATPPVREIARPNPDALFARCTLASLAIILLGIGWSVWTMFHHFRDIPSELETGRVIGRKVVMQAQRHVLAPGQQKVWPFVLSRPPNGQTSYVLAHYKANTVEGHVFLGLAKGPPQWESVSGVCASTVRRAYSGGLGPREQSFGRKLEFGDDSTMEACVEIKNFGKKTQALVDVEIWLEYLENSRSRP